MREDRRGPTRSYIEPYDTDTSIGFTLENKKYRFRLLDTAPGGIGMLVRRGEKEVLEKLTTGDRLIVDYGDSDTNIPMNFEVRHVTGIKMGAFEGHYQVGLCLISNL